MQDCGQSTYAAGANLNKSKHTAYIFCLHSLGPTKHNRTETTMTKSVAQVKIGEKLVPAIGFGAMGFSYALYGEVSGHEDRFKVSGLGYIWNVR